MSETSKTKAKGGQAPTLGDLRAEIDRIDAEIHERLIERGEIIGELIKVKGTQDSGAAFRPAREADMMRRLVQRHRGILPLDTVESIWRVIISTFTYVQAPYSVHADMSGGDAGVRDSARFHFGFTVPLRAHGEAAAVISAVAASRGDLGLVPARSVATGAAWWTALESETAPKIIARVPFVERSDHPASFPLFVVSKPVEAAVMEVETWSVRVAGWSPAAARAASALAEVLAVPDALDGAALLASLPPGRKLSELTEALVKAGSTVRATALVGGHANRYTV
jgi:chorismate mutase